MNIEDKGGTIGLSTQTVMCILIAGMVNVLAATGLVIIKFLHRQKTEKE